MAGALIGLLCVFGLVWIVPPALDWNAHRVLIARFASAELGRPIEIDGPVTVTLLPSPTLTAGGVWLGDKGDGIRMEAPSLTLDLAPLPLLFGHLVPRGLALRDATIHLPWPLPPAALALNRAALAGVRTARIENAHLSLGRVELTGLSAGLSANAGAEGRLLARGSATLLGHAVRFSVGLDPADAEGNAPIDLVAAPPLPIDPAHPPADFGAHLTGVLRADGALAGHVSAEVADLAQFVDAPAGPVTLAGPLVLGDGPARGTLQIGLGGTVVAAELGAGADGEQTLALRAASLNVTPWLAMLRLRPGRPRPSLPRPPVRVGISLAANSLILPGGSLVDANAALTLDPSGIGTISHAEAILPGEAHLSLSGRIGRDPHLSFSGPFSLSAPQLHRTLAWLAGMGVKLGASWPAGALQSANLTGDARLTRLAVDLSGLQGRVDGSQVGGRVSIDPGSGAVDAELGVDRIAADDWLPTGGLPGWTALSRSLEGLSVTLRLKAGAVKLRGRTATGVRIDAATAGGGVTLNGVDALLDGMALHAAGTFAADGTVSGLVGDVTADHAAALAAVLPGLVDPNLPIWSAPLHVRLEATGPRQAVLASVALDLAEARLEAHPTINLDAESWATQVTLRHPGAARLMHALGWDSAPRWLGDGSLSALAQLSGAKGQMLVSSYDLTAAGLHATGDATLTLPAVGVPVLSGHVNADTLPLPLPRAEDPVPLALGWLRGVAATVSVNARQVRSGNTELASGASGVVTIGSGKLSVSVGRATLGGGSVTGQWSLDSTMLPPSQTITAQLSGIKLTGGLFGLPVDLASGTLDARLDLRAVGASPRTLVASLGGTIDAQVAAGSLGGIDLAAAPDDPPGSGATPFTALHLQAALANGVAVLGDSQLSGAVGTVALSGQIDLADRRLNLLASWPDGHFVRLHGPAAAPVRH